MKRDQRWKVAGPRGGPWRLTTATWLTVVVGFLAGVNTASASMRFDHLTIDDGLSQSAVLAVHQDSRGFLWFGTEDGLNRYDGHEVRVYSHERGNPASLSADYVWDLDEDAAGRLWIATVGGGVNRFDPVTGAFSSYRHDPQNPASLASDRIRSVQVDEDGSVWVGTLDAGLDRLDPRTGEVAHVRLRPESDTAGVADAVYAVHRDSEGVVWVATDGGLVRLEPESGRVERFVHDPETAGTLPADEVRAILEDHSGALWIGTWGGGLARLDREGGFVTFRHDPADPASLPDDRIQALLEDRDGRLLIATPTGLAIRHRGRAVFESERNDPLDRRSLASDVVMSLHEDRGGVVWLGTRTAGVDRWNPATLAFGHVAPGNEETALLLEPNATSFTEDRRGRLWVGTFGGGIEILDRSAWTAERLRHRPGRRDALSSDRVMTLLRDREGTVWVGTMGGGLNRLREDGSVLSVYRHDPADDTSLPSDAIMTVFEDVGGAVWVGTFGGGLARLDAATGRFVRYRHDPDGGAGLTAGRVTSLEDGPREWLWIGTEGGGLNALDRRTGEFMALRHDPLDTASLGSDVVYALHADASGVLWVGTRGGGLSRVDGHPSSPHSLTVRTWTERDGLPDDDIYGILESMSGELWLSTNRGLSRFDPESETFTNFDDSHGLQADEFHFGSHYRSTSGELFFGGVNGFNGFYPDRLSVNRHVPPVVLTRILLQHQPLDLAALTTGAPIDLGYRDDVVSFEFAALDFAAPERNRFTYRLVGFDEEWTEAGSERRATYTDLDGGSYRFEVRAANNDGVWNEQGLTVPVEVESPPWATTWAYGLYAVAALGALFAYGALHRRRLRREEEYSAQLEREVETRTGELAERARQLETLNEKLVQASLTDSLTGMANRRYLFEWVEKEVAQLQRQYEELATGSIAPDSFDLVFLMIDLDEFKSVNDTCGHYAGDQVLREVRQVLDESCRMPDLMIRWGGDEFLVVARGSSPEEVARLAERIRSEIEERPFVVEGGQVVRLTCSIGVACYPFVKSDLETMSWDQVVNVADVALYAAKRSGRNAWVGLFSTERTFARGLLRGLRENPAALVDAGEVVAMTSIEDPANLAWQPFRSRSSTAPLVVPEPSRWAGNEV